MKKKFISTAAAILSLFSIVVPSIVASGKERKNHGENHKLIVETATFAGGCFWCVEADLEKVPGVISVVSGFSGGPEKNPDYYQVATGKTGHRESVQVTFDTAKTSYQMLLDAFFRHMDPTDPGGQFTDRGFQYTTAVFYHNDKQKAAAEKYMNDLAASGRFTKPLATKIVKYENFYPAGSEHQDYYKKNPLNYKTYRRGSGRDAFIGTYWNHELSKMDSRKWFKPDAEAIRKRLSPLEYHVTQENGTEPPFNNLFWNNKQQGIYVDIVSGEPLFSSRDKFDSGTGWPSFTRPLVAGNVVEKKDRSLFMVRTEVRSAHGDSHLGHVFDDGPAPTGLRYCINSASLRFIPRENLKTEGYGEYEGLFEGK